MSKKIVFMGTPEFATETLSVLANSHHKISCVYTQPPKKSFRGQKINPSAVQLEAEQLKLKIRTPNNFADHKEYEYFKSLNPYIVIVVAYGKIIPKKYLDIPEKGFINIHASLLPNWRGAAPIQRSIMNSDKETGISIMQIQEELDTGPYMKQIKTSIERQHNAKNISKKLSKLSSENILECIKEIENGSANFLEQKHDQASYAKKIEKSEAKIAWNDSAKKILAKINALNPSPGAWFQFNEARYKIWKAKHSEKTGGPGELLDEKLTIACGEKSIQITEIQKEGKKKLLSDEFLIGSNIPKGSKVF